MYTNIFVKIQYQVKLESVLNISMGKTSDFEQCSHRLQFDLISILVSVSCEMGQIMTRYGFLWEINQNHLDLYI